MTVVHYEPPPPLPASRPGDELVEGPTGDVARLRAAAEYAGYIADTEFVPDPLRGRTAAVAAAILAGGELGLKPIVALRVIAIIKGRPSVSAEGQRGLVSKAGHEIWFEETTTTRAIAAGRRAGTERIGRVTWTMDDAKRAGLAGQQNYQRYPAEMLRARASAALARSMFADVTLGIPASEELEGEPLNGLVLDAPTPEPPADAPKPPRAGRARQRPKTTPPPSPAPPPAARAPLAPTPPEDTQPEPPIPTAPNDQAIKKMFALYRDKGMGGPDDRERRLAYAERVLQRPIKTSSELNALDVSRVIDALAAEPDPPSPFQPPPGAMPASEQAIISDLEGELDARQIDEEERPPLPDDDP